MKNIMFWAIAVFVAVMAAPLYARAENLTIAVNPSSLELDHNVTYFAKLNSPEGTSIKIVCVKSSDVFSWGPDFQLKVSFVGSDHYRVDAKQVKTNLKTCENSVAGIIQALVDGKRSLILENFDSSTSLYSSVKY